MKWFFKENYPVIALLVMLIMLLLDVQNYQLLIISSNLLGFSLATNKVLLANYKKNTLSKYCIYGLSLLNFINIIACFFESESEYQNYFKILMIVVLLIVLLIPLLFYVRRRIKE